MPRRYSVWDAPSRRYEVYETPGDRPDYNVSPPAPVQPPLTQLGDPPEAFLQRLPYSARFVGMSDTPQGTIAAPKTGWGMWALATLAFVGVVWAGTRSR